MNDIEQTTGKEPWYKVWFKVYFSPSVNTYQSLIHSSNATLSRGMTWVAVGTGINVFFPLFLYWISNGRILHDDLADALNASGEMGWVMYAISGFFAIAFSAIFFSITIKIIDWLAQKMGGTTNAERLGFLTGAIWTPGGIIETVIEGLSPIAIGLTLRLIIFSIEAVLLTIGLRAANQLNLWKAIVVIIILGILILVIAGILASCLAILQ